MPINQSFIFIFAQMLFMIRKTAALLAILAFTLSSCESKININADYSTTPIIFGLLDHADSVHYIKITKTFLGEGNNFEFAKVADSSYFRNVSAKVVELYQGAETGREWSLKDSTINTKADGVFYNPSQKVYVFYENDLKEDHEYKLIANLNEGEHQIDATTSMIDGFKYNLFNLSKLNFAALNASQTGNYKIAKIYYDEALNAQRYQTYFVFTIRETYADNSTKLVKLKWINSVYNGINDEDINPDNPKDQIVTFSGEGFYQFIQSQLEVDENVTRRELVQSKLVTEIAHKELVRYMDISEPSSSLAQSTPLFTNVNGGLGIFSSRHISEIENIEMVSTSIEELCTGQYTTLLRFCSSDPSHTEELFYCD